MKVGIEWSFQRNDHYSVWFAKKWQNDHYLRNHHSTREVEEWPFHSFIQFSFDQNALHPPPPSPASLTLSSSSSLTSPNLQRRKLLQQELLIVIPWRFSEI
ncbi:hypothetical protein AAC387_Pa02g1429 [Persea americana]